MLLVDHSHSACDACSANLLLKSRRWATIITRVLLLLYFSMFSPLRRPGDYQNHAANTPATPRGSSSPLNALSPIADAVRHATKEGTRDWHRMLGSLPEWTQPYSSERQVLALSLSQYRLVCLQFWYSCV